MTVTTKPQRFAVTYHPNDPILDFLEELKKLNRGLFSYADLIKIAVKEKLERSQIPDLTLQDIERIGWDNISTQELIDRYPPYRDNFLASNQNITTVPKSEVKELEQELGIQLVF